MMFAPSVETRSPAEQLALDNLNYQTQIEYLFKHSRFYQQKFKAAGLADAKAVGRLEDIGAVPLSEKAEIRASCTAENPIGSHLCVPRSEIIRIYSTSGTTGAPSYIPLTEADLDRWTTASATSYGASGVSAGERIVSTYNAGPFVAGVRKREFPERWSRSPRDCHYTVQPVARARFSNGVFMIDDLLCFGGIPS